MKQIEFERALKRHCIKHRADCTECDLRLYCHIPPIERTDAMMLSVIKYLEQDTDEYAALEHHPGCPLEIRFEGAVGYEGTETMQEGDGICVCVGPEDPPDYKIIAINDDFIPAQITMERI